MLEQGGLLPPTRTHLVIPDTQSKEGVPTDHLGWIGEYIVEKQPEVVVHLGDHWDMPSLSSFDVGKRDFEGRRYWKDIESANAAFDILCEPMKKLNAKRKVDRHAKYKPELHFLLGNHEYRINRAANDDAKLDGLISTNDLNVHDHKWTVHPFLKPVVVDGVSYAHYWANPMTGRPYGGAALTRLKTIGKSFTMGHQQTLDYAVRFVGERSHHGLVCGAAYLHEESYLGPQGNAHWRGIVVKHEVDEGSYDPMFVSLSYLCRRYEGKSLEKFMARIF